MLSSYNYIQILEIKEMLDNLKNRTDRIDSEIRDIYGKINDLYSKTSDIYKKINNINDRINKMDIQITNMEKEINYLKSKKYLYIQDTPPKDTSAAYISPKDMLLRIYKNGKWVPIGAVFL